MLDTTLDTITLQSIPLIKTNQFSQDAIGDEIDAVIVDVETTGLDIKKDKIIELGMVKVKFSPSTGQVTSISDPISMYEDPQDVISEKITKITGITNEMVANQVIDENVVNNYMANDPLIIAHNANFDRKFFDRRFPSLSNLRWACSLKGINWDEFESAKLRYLLIEHGYFYQAHRASIDCLATAFLLSLNKEYVKQLLSSEKDSYLIAAVGAPFAVKDKLSGNGYTFYGEDKTWKIEVYTEDEVKQQLEFLNKLYYSSVTLKEKVITSRQRFK